MRPPRLGSGTKLAATEEVSHLLELAATATMAFASLVTLARGNVFLISELEDGKPE